jgi:hypothetical protein
MCALTQPFQTLQVILRLDKLSSSRHSNTWDMTSAGSCSQSRKSFGFCKMLFAAQNRRMIAVGSVDRSLLFIIILPLRVLQSRCNHAESIQQYRSHF